MMPGRSDDENDHPPGEKDRPEAKKDDTEQSDLQLWSETHHRADPERLSLAWLPRSRLLIVRPPDALARGRPCQHARRAHAKRRIEGCCGISAGSVDGSGTARSRTGLLTCADAGGPEGIRTPDLLPAEQALYHLSYRPSGCASLPAVTPPAEQAPSERRCPLVPIPRSAHRPTASRAGRTRGLPR
jgi:hypothetical protein